MQYSPQIDIIRSNKLENKSQQKIKIDHYIQKQSKKKKKLEDIKIKKIQDWDQLAKIYVPNPQKLNNHHLKQLIKISTEFKKQKRINFVSQLETKVKSQLVRRNNFLKEKKSKKTIKRPRSGYSNLNHFQYQMKRNSQDKNNYQYQQKIKRRRYHNKPQTISPKSNLIRQSKKTNICYQEVDSQQKIIPYSSFMSLKKQPKSIISPQDVNTIRKMVQQQFYRTSFTPYSKQHRQYLKRKNQTSQQLKIDKVIQIKNESKQKRVNLKKLFSLNSKDDYIRRILIKNGWKECNLQSKIYTLKWSYKENNQDFQLLKSSLQQKYQGCSNQLYFSKYYNHIKNNSMVTKIGLYHIYCKLMAANKRPYYFMPRSYHLMQQYNLFEEEFLETTITIIIKKHYQYFISVFCQKWLNELHQRIPGLSLNNLFKLLSNGSINRIISFTNYQTPVNIPILLYTLIFAQNIINKKCLDEQLLNEGQKFQKKYEKILNDLKIIKLIRKFSKIQIPYCQYENMRYSNLNENKNIKNNNIQDIEINLDQNNYIRIKSNNNFLPPSLQLILIVIKFHKIFLNKNYYKYTTDGVQNLWILKPVEGSKGIGIEISCCIQQIKNISTNSISDRIIQKYVQNIWILNETVINKIQNQNIKNQLQKSKLYNKKFDIRQWILFSYPNVYIFSHFYIKICSVNYNLKLPKQLQSHLSNYSINLQNYNQQQQYSVMNQSQFQQILNMLELYNKLEQIKNKIRQYSKKIVKEGMNSFENIDGCFQIVGIDIIIDKDMNPWILQINMSPACSQRTSWLINMCENMGQDTLRKILPKQLWQDNGNKLQYHWILLDNEQKYNQTSAKIQIEGKQCIKLQEIKKNEEHKLIYNPYSFINKQKVIKIQNVIRRFLRKQSQY